MSVHAFAAGGGYAHGVTGDQRLERSPLGSNAGDLEQRIYTRLTVKRAGEPPERGRMNRRGRRMILT